MHLSADPGSGTRPRWADQICRGIGCPLTDVNDKLYLDMMVSMSCAMYEQEGRTHYVGTGDTLTEPIAKLASKVASLALGQLSKMIFVSGGSEAVEPARKIAKQYRQQSGRKP